MKCMPWPLAVLCWLDNRAHDRRGGGAEGADLLCRAHDEILMSTRYRPQEEP